MKNNKIVNIEVLKLNKLLHDEEYQRKVTKEKRQELYDYDYKNFLKKRSLKSAAIRSFQTEQKESTI